MKKYFVSLLLVVVLVSCNHPQEQSLPFLRKQGTATQLIVHGEPFIMLCGEANNSTGSHAKFLEEVLKSLRANSFNSVLVSVSWEIIEPKEGVFDFSSVDEILRIARQNDIKVGVLWFASWKNGYSPYAPDWVLSDVNRFKRVKTKDGYNTLTLSPLCVATRDADAKAYSELMKHLAKVDSKENTVIIVQIENEVGVLRQTRDFSDEANQLFMSQVPKELMDYLVANKSKLETEIITPWESNGSKTTGTWTEIFGDNDDTDMFFMAWQYSSFIDHIAKQGKQVYHIPMFVNAWMAGSRPNPGKPGNYPSGGPILSALDIWKAGAPNIDLLTPDIYANDYKDRASWFHREDNPLFIPETHQIEGRATYAFAEHDAICLSPFAIDRSSSNLEREYRFLRQMMPLIIKYQGTGLMRGIIKDLNEESVSGCEFMLNKDTKVRITYQNVNRRPTTETTSDNRQQAPPSYGIFIKTGENEFMIAGLNISVSCESLNPSRTVWLKNAREGIIENGEFKPQGLHNGDEAGFLRGDNPSYRIRSLLSPSDPGIMTFSVISYDK